MTERQGRISVCTRLSCNISSSSFNLLLIKHLNKSGFCCCIRLNGTIINKDLGLTRPCFKIMTKYYIIQYFNYMLLHLRSILIPKVFPKPRCCIRLNVTTTHKEPSLNLLLLRNHDHSRNCLVWYVLFL